MPKTRKQLKKGKKGKTLKKGGECPCMKNKKNLLSFFKGGKNTRGNKTRGNKARTMDRRRKSMRGGAYIDVPSFAGDVNQATTASYAFNQNAGTLADPTTATNQLPSRLGGDLSP